MEDRDADEERVGTEEQVVGAGANDTEGRARQRPAPRKKFRSGNPADDNRPNRLHERIPGGNHCAAVATTATEQQPPQHRDVVMPADG